MWKKKGDHMLTWLLIASLILFGWGEGIWWAHDHLEKNCLRANQELLLRGAEGPLQQCSGGTTDGEHETR